MSYENGLGKSCPSCGEPMSNMPSLNMRQCATGCKMAVDWLLDEGQKPLIANNRHDRKGHNEV